MQFCACTHACLVFTWYLHVHVFVYIFIFISMIRLNVFILNCNQFICNFAFIVFKVWFMYMFTFTKIIHLFYNHIYVDNICVESNTCNFLNKSIKGNTHQSTHVCLILFQWILGTIVSFLLYADIPSTVYWREYAACMFMLLTINNPDIHIYILALQLSLSISRKGSKEIVWSNFFYFLCEVSILRYLMLWV